jgi:tetratricopeptide (TPR) repeat protein
MRLSHGLFSMVALIVAYGCAPHSQLHTDPDTNVPVTHVSATEAQTLLQANRFSELDRDFSALQSDYVQGRIGEEQVRDSFRAFYPTDPQLAAKFDAWVAQFPKSYVAHLARAIYYKKVGQEQRGGAYASDTTSEQFHNMEVAMKKSAQDLQLSLTLDPKPMLSLNHAIDIATFLGDPDSGRKFLDRALGLDSEAFLVRVKYMGNLQSRWGGSPQEMQAFLDECRKARLSKAHLDELASMVAVDRIWSHVHGDRDMAAAMLDYQTARSLEADICTECSLSEMVSMLMEQGRYPDAISVLSDILQYKPNDAYARCTHADALQHMRRLQEAVAEFKRGADSGLACAQVNLGGLYMNGVPGVLERNLDAGIQLFRDAAAQGDPAGIENLKRAQAFAGISASRPANP